MNSATVFRYELKRSLVSKEYGLLILLLLFYTGYTLRNTLLPGYAGTAPFSAWSFTSYMLAICPVLSMILLFQVSRLSSPYEKDAAAITSATPGSGGGYVILRLAVAALGWLAATAVALMAGVAFLGIVFGEIRPLDYLACFALVLLPPCALLLGLGLWAGKLHHTLPYVLVIAVLALRVARPAVSPASDALGSSLLHIADTSTPVSGEIAFVLPAGFLVSRGILAVTGLALTITGAPHFHSRARR